MKILVTGATGFLGSHLCRRLVAEGHQVRALTRPRSDRSRLAGLNVEFAEGDVTDSPSVLNAVSGCAAVIHSAASIRYWQQEASEQLQVNEGGTTNVVAAGRPCGVQRLVHVSSVAAIGPPARGQGPASEETPFRMESSSQTYGLSKHRGELVVLKGVQDGLDAVIVNPSTIFGPYGERYRGWEMLEKVRRSRIVPCFSGGICVAHVDDVVGGILSAISRGVRGERYILGGENISYRELAERAAMVMGVPRHFVTLGPMVTGPASLVLETISWATGNPPRISRAAHFYAHRRLFYDSSKARRELGYEFRPFEAILREAVEFMSGGKKSP